MALTDYSIDTSGSPQEVQRKQALADALMKQGMDSTPAAGGKNGGWVTALNRGLAGALGGYQRGAAADMEQQGRSRAQQLAAGLIGPDGKIDQQGYMKLASDPWANPQQLGAVGKVHDWQHTAERDKVGDQHWGASFGLQSNADKRAAAAEGRAASDFESTPDQYVPNPRANEPGQPAYIDQYAAAAAAAKPSTTARPLTAEERTAYGLPANSPAAMTADGPKAIGSPVTNVNTSVDTRAENEQSKTIGKAKGEVQAEDIKAGSHATSKLRQLSTLDDANRAGGDDISSGPLGKAILSGKQGFSELTGIDLKGVPESEVIQKVGFGLATNMVKAISSRPSQMEFAKALENVPGLYMSKQGRVAMTSILKQDAEDERELGRLANKHRDTSDGLSWQEVKDKYYEEHPIISPFTGKPFGESDVQMLTKAGGRDISAATAAAPGGRVEKKIGNTVYYTKPDQPGKWFHD